LAEALLALKKTYGYDEDGFTIAMYMAREDLANMSNMTTSNAIRTLSQFASEGIISLDGRKIKLLDEQESTRISRLG
jgi:CRP-like cAMP-binding protein